MPWDDRLREAAYTSPDGTRTVFLYDDVSRTIEKKTTGFEFPDADGTFVQDLGHSGRRYPLRVIFSGANYDLAANVFELTLLERGTGKLEHPIYGVVNVVPFGEIRRRDNLKTAANQAIIEVTFWETIGVIYPAAQTDPSGAVLDAVTEYNLAMAEELAATTDLAGAVNATTFLGDYNALLDSAEDGLRAVADAQDNVRRQFDTIVDSINRGIDVLIAQPLTLAFQTIQMLQAPARALTSILARLEAYRNLADSIISGDGAIAKPGIIVKPGVTGDPRPANGFRANDLFASTLVTGSIVSVVNNRFETKIEALQAAEAVLTQMEEVTNWRDDNFESLGEIDTGDSYQQLQEAVALTIGFLVQISFTLKQERRITLDRTRTIIDLVAELYGTVDEELDFFITSNGLTGSEILEIPEGREIVYYV